MLVVCCKFIFPFMAYHWFPNYKNTMVAISSRAGTAHPARAPGCTHGFNEFQVVHSFFFFVVIYKSLFGLLLAIVLSVLRFMASDYLLVSWSFSILLFASVSSDRHNSSVLSLASHWLLSWICIRYVSLNNLSCTLLKYMRSDEKW